MSDVSVVIEDGGSIVVEEVDYGISRLAPEIQLDIASSESPDDVTVEHAIQDVCVVVSEIELKIFGWSLSDWWNKNFADLHLQVTVISGEFDAISQVVLELKAQIEDPFTGNTALSSLIFSLTAEVHNHYGDLSAHSELFLALQSQITDNAGDIIANAENTLTLTTEVHVNANEISALATTVNALKVSIEQLEDGLSAQASLIAANTVSIHDLNGELTIHGQSLTAIDLRLENAEGELIAHSSALESLDANIYRIDGEITVQANKTLELTAQMGTSFNPAIAWEFTEDDEGWYGTHDGDLLWETETITILGDSSAHINFLAIDGDAYPLVAIRWKRLIGSSWEGAVYFKYANGPTGWTIAKTFADIPNQVDFSTSIVDCSLAFAGKRISDIAIKFSSSPEAKFVIDSVGIGRRSAVGTYASIKREEIARVNADEALSQSITSWETSLGLLDARISQEIVNRITAEGEIDLRYNIVLDNGRITGTFLHATLEETEMIFVMDHFYMYLPGGGYIPGQGVVPAQELKVFEAGLLGDGTYGIILRNCLIEQTIKSANYQHNSDGYYGWIIEEDGAAEFNEISIYNNKGELILSSGAGLNLKADELAKDLTKQMEDKITETVTTPFLEESLTDFKKAIEDNTLTYIDNLLVRNAWIKNAYIDHLAVGTSNIQAQAVTVFNTEALAGVPRTYPGTIRGTNTSTAILQFWFPVPANELSNGEADPVPPLVRVYVKVKGLALHSSERINSLSYIYLYHGTGFDELIETKTLLDSPENLTNSWDDINTYPAPDKEITFDFFEDYSTGYRGGQVLIYTLRINCDRHSYWRISEARFFAQAFKK